MFYIVYIIRLIEYNAEHHRNSERMNNAVGEF